MQPSYLPWLGFFELMANCDLFVLLDDVQYTKKDWRSRNEIRTKDGCIWVTVPILTKNRRKQPIMEARINNNYPWSQKHLKALKVNYSKSAYYKKYIDFFEHVYNQRWEYLIDLDIEIISFMAEQFGISTPFIRSSALSIYGYSGNGRILEICKRLKANELYDSAGARAFIDLNIFEQEGIKVIFQDYIHPVYRQVYQPFLSYMSAIDLLFNEGPKSKSILLRCEYVI